MLRESAAAVLAAVLACGCAREPSPPVSTSHPHDISLAVQSRTIEAVVPPNATLGGLLRDQQLSGDLVHAVIQSAASVFNLREIRENRPYRLVVSLDGLLEEFEYEIDTDRFLRVFTPDRSRPDVLKAEVLPFEKETVVSTIHGQIDEDHPSLIAAVDSSGENVQLAMSLAGIFSGQIDFDSDLQPGDGFDVVFEKSTRDGEFAGYGEILGARFTADQREHQAFRWTDPQTGKAAYYDENGRSLKRFMLRTPLRFEPRITSGFSRRRLHPVFRTYRAHLGIDYGAPTGAPVVAVSAGTVVSAGWAGGGGNQVRLRHSGGYETYYLHLSAFGPGIRAGVHVDLGQVIGRVGSTGTATGPHLDFRVKRNGVFVNPLVVQRSLPPGDPIPQSMLPAFYQVRDEVLHGISEPAVALASK
jgi:murein DD-endopeptidase MepM/ murein hydrolase activator NlpD